MSLSGPKAVSFIKQVQKYPLIWDSTNPDYENTIKKQNAFDIIATNFECMNGQEAQIRWNTLRTRYREYRQMNTKWTRGGFWSNMRFLDKEENDRKATNNSEADETESIFEPDEQEEPQVKRPRSEEICTDLASRTQNGEQEPKVKRSRFERMFTDNASPTQVSHEQNSLIDTSELAENSKPKNYYENIDNYVAGVASKLREIKQKINLLSVQRQIDNIIYDALLEECKSSI